MQAGQYCGIHEINNKKLYKYVDIYKIMKYYRSINNNTTTEHKMLKVTEQQMKLAAVFQGLILPMNFENTDLAEISFIAYAHIHTEPEIHKNWAELMDAYTWLKKFPFQSWDQWLADDKFGYFKDNMEKSIQTFKKNGLIR